MQEISLSFVDEEISDWGGAAILKKMPDRMLPKHSGNGGYPCPADNG